ncbi:MAG: hypothetical protein ABL907_13545 [Hyphomicrobium sp.]
MAANASAAPAVRSSVSVKGNCGGERFADQFAFTRARANSNILQNSRSAN